MPKYLIGPSGNALNLKTKALAGSIGQDLDILWMRLGLDGVLPA